MKTFKLYLSYKASRLMSGSTKGLSGGGPRDGLAGHRQQARGHAGRPSLGDLHEARGAAETRIETPSQVLMSIKMSFHFCLKSE